MTKQATDNSGIWSRQHGMKKSKVRERKKVLKVIIVSDITVLMWDKQDCAAAQHSSAELCRRTNVTKWELDPQIDSAGWPDILLWILILLENYIKVKDSQTLPQSSTQMSRLQAMFQWVPTHWSSELQSMMEVQNLSVTFGDMCLLR